MAKRGTQEQGFVWRTAELYLNRAEAYAGKYAAGIILAGKNRQMTWMFSVASVYQILQPIH